MKRIQNKVTQHPDGHYILTITMRSGEVVNILVDAVDVEAVRHLQWHITDGGYARATKQKMSLYMHRFLMGLGRKVPEKVDHKDGNIRDNRRHNLRICIHGENMKNKGMSKNNSTGFKGVSVNLKNGKYRAQIMHNKHYVEIGHFDSKEDAARAYNQAATQYHGEFARLNQL